MYYLRLLALCFALFTAQSPAFAQAPGDAEPEALNEQVLALIKAGKYAEAIPLVEQYVGTARARFGENAPELATALGTQAVLLAATNRFDEAESSMRRALEIDEANFGPDHPNIAARLHSLALFLQIRNRLAEAEPLMQRALEIDEKNYGPDAPQVAVALNGLAGIFKETNRLAEAEPLMRRALAILEKNSDPDDPNIMTSLNNLGRLLQDTNRFAEAEPLMRRALEIGEKSFGTDHPNILASLSQLAGLLRDTNREAEAEPLLRRAVAIAEKSYGPDHAVVATHLNNLAGLLQSRNRLAEAEPLMRRALSIAEKSLGPDHPNVATNLDALAGLLEATNRLAEAEPLIRRALEIDEKSYGPDHPSVAARLSSLAVLLQITNRPDDAEPLMRRALEIDETSYGPDHPNVAVRLTGLALLLQATNRHSEAEPLLRRALEIDEKAYGPDHPNVATRLTGLALLLQAENRPQEAEPLTRRALAIFEKSYGPEHPNVATTLVSLAQSLQATNRRQEAEPLMRRALSIFEKSYGADSFLVGITLNNLAQLLQATNRLDEAEPLMRRVIEILEKALGPDHPLVATSLNNLAALKEDQGDWAAATALYARAKPIMIGSPGAGSNSLDFGKAVLAQNTGNLRAYARALYRSDSKSAVARAEAFTLAQWALQNDAADALSSMALRFAKGEGGLAALVRENQDLRAARENAYRRLDQAAGKADRQGAEEARATLATLNAKLAEAASRLRDEFPDYAELAIPRPLSIEEAQALLNGHQALILFLDLAQYGKAAEETLVFAITKEDVRWLSVPLGTRALWERVKALRCGLDHSNWLTQDNQQLCERLLGAESSEEDLPPFDAAAAYALYRDLFGRLEDLIKDKSLLIVPSGAFTQLPFEVLVTAKPESTLPRFKAYKKAAWLAQRQPIAILPSVGSLRALRNARTSKATEPYIGFGNPLLIGVDGDDRSAFEKQSCPKVPAAKRTRVASVAPSSPPPMLRGGRFDVEALRRQPPLPEAADELCEIAQAVGISGPHLDETVYLGEGATVAQVKTLSRSGALARAKVVHFATHGLLAGETALFLKNGAEPALLLTPPREASEEDNGLLTASEVAQLKLDADWVILSACNTAAGASENSEALSGLARAFFYAGARSLLVSHWSVNSDAAVAITTGAMKAIEADPKIGRAEAVRRSIVALIARHKGGAWDHPSVWAPFVLVGNGEP